MSVKEGSRIKKVKKEYFMDKKPSLNESTKKTLGTKSVFNKSFNAT